MIEVLIGHQSHQHDTVHSISHPTMPWYDIWIVLNIKRPLDCWGEESSERGKETSQETKPEKVVCQIWVCEKLERVQIDVAPEVVEGLLVISHLRTKVLDSSFDIETRRENQSEKDGPNRSAYVSLKSLLRWQGNQRSFSENSSKNEAAGIINEN